MCDVATANVTWNSVTQTFSQTGDNDSCVSSRQQATKKCEGEKLLQMINIYKCVSLFVVVRFFPSEALR